MRIGIIGGGKVGTCLATYLKAKNMLVGITASNEKNSQRLAERFHLEATDNRQLTLKVDILLLTVPDRLVESVAESIAVDGIEGKIVLHVSGSLGLEPLESLTRKGAHVGSMHPLQSFAANTTTELAGVYMAIDGDNIAREIAAELAEKLGGKPFYVPAEERAAYHAAACICSNYAVTVEALAQKLMARWTGSEEDGWKALKPLFKGTAANLLRTDNAQSALTGPIGRGDINTVRKHLEVMPGEMQELYCLLGMATVDVALHNKTISVSDAESLEKLLQHVREIK